MFWQVDDDALLDLLTDTNSIVLFLLAAVFYHIGDYIVSGHHRPFALILSAIASLPFLLHGILTNAKYLDFYIVFHWLSVAACMFGLALVFLAVALYPITFIHHSLRSTFRSTAKHSPLCQYS